MQARGIKQLFGQRTGRLVVLNRARTVRVRLQLPIAAFLKIAIVPGSEVAGLERLHAANCSPRRRNMAKLQKSADAMRGNARRNNSRSEKGLDFRSEDNPIGN